MEKSLDLTESSDFHYLLQLLPPLYKEPAFAWLPELFSIIGYEKLLVLCKYAGGEKIKIPTIEQLSDSVEALSWFYKVYIAKSARITSVPPELAELVRLISEAYSDAKHN